MLAGRLEALTIDLTDWGLGRVPAEDMPVDGLLARVVRVDRGECDVITEAGRVRVLSDSQRAQGEVAPVTGDWVEIRDEAGLGEVIGRVLPRHTQVSRRDPAERDLEQVLASNVDLVGVVHGLDRPLPPGRLERLLVIAANSGADPVVILSKADLAVDQLTEEIVRSVARDIPVVVTSAADGSGLQELTAMIGAGRSLALVGASGVGKSALVNALAGEDVLETGEVRGRDAKGRHTTTARELVLLPGDGGLVLDTPGIRAIGLWEAEHALHFVFGDLEELADECRFRDCTHGNEPGCAVLGAVTDGRADSHRVERFKALAVELAAQREREEERVRREQKSGDRRGRRRR